jgi:hypothetical protein
MSTRTIPSINHKKLQHIFSIVYTFLIVFYAYNIIINTSKYINNILFELKYQTN